MKLSLFIINLGYSNNFKFKIYQMKTKFLLGALTLPMFFAACTNEELIENSVNANLQNRIPLGDVTLDLGNADSRLALEDGSYSDFEWSNGDDLGASLIDVVGVVNPNPQSLAEIIDQYNLTATPQTNYRYVYNDGAWTSNAAMVEGNYVFYMPYVESTKRVAPLAVLPTVQSLEQVTINGETAYTTYNDVLENAQANGNIMAVAYKFLTAEGDNNDGNKTISISFKQLYATPLISIQNYARNNENELTDLTIKQIRLSLADNSDFTVKGYLNFTANNGVTATTEAWAKNDNSIVDCLNTVLDASTPAYKGGSWASLNGINNKTKRETGNLLSAYSDAQNTQLSKTITINVEDPITVASEETFAFYAVIPGGDYTTSKLKVTLITTDDKAVDVTLPGAHINPGKRYAVGGYDAEGNVEAGATALMAVTTKKLVDAPVFVETAVPVATQAELYAAIATAQMLDTDEDGTPDTQVALEFIPAEGVVLNDQVISMLEDKKTEIASVVFKGNMAVSGLTTTTDVQVKILGNATLKNVVENTEIVSTFTADKLWITGSITVAEGAEVELKGAVNAGITNNGTLTIVDATSAADHITNNSVLNLKANLTLAAGKDLTNAAEATINSVVASNLTANKVINNGTIAVSDAELTVTAVIENKGIINAAQDLSVTKDVVNKENAEMNISAAATSITTPGVFTNEGTVTIAEGATLTATTSSSINKNVIDNAGTLSIDMNIGTINVTNSSKFGTSTTTVNSTHTNAQSVVVWGNIYNPYAKTIGTNALNGTASQYVWNSEEAYTGTVALDAAATTYNAIKFNGATVNATIVTGLKYVEFNGQSKLNPTTDLTFTTVKVNATELEITGTSELTITEFIVSEGATVGWNSALTLEGNVYNYGKIYGNAGTVNATCYDAGGQYLGVISWPSLDPMP